MAKALKVLCVACLAVVVFLLALAVFVPHQPNLPYANSGEFTTPDIAPRPPQLVLNDLQIAIRQAEPEAANRLEAELAESGEAAVPLLAAELKHAVPSDAAAIELQQRAAAALGLIGSPAATQALVEAFKANLHDEVRGQILLALSQSALEGARGQLEAVLRHELETLDLRSSAALLLVRRDEPGTTEVLLDVLKTETAPQLRMALVDALGFSPQRQIAGAALLKFVKSQEAEKLRAQAMLALVRVLKVDAPRIVTDLLAFDLPSQVRQQAVVGLGELESGPATRDLLVRLLKKDSNQGVRALAADRLGASGDPAALAALTEAVSSEREIYVQLKMLQAIGAIGGQGAQKVLRKIAATAQQPSRIRNEARAQLRKLNQPDEPPQPSSVTDEYFDDDF